MIIVRYADDFIVGFQHEEDARRFLERCVSGYRSLRCRFIRRRPGSSSSDDLRRKTASGAGLASRKPSPSWASSSSAAKSPGEIPDQRKSRRDRMRVKLQAIKQELRRRMHQSIPEQGRWLKQVVTGYFNYHAVPTNGPTLTAFRFHVTNLWRRTLRRRSQKDWTTKERTARLANDWLPKPRILHPWPDARFAVRHPRWEPYARIGPVRLCAGGAR